MVKSSFLEGIKFSFGILFIFGVLSFGYAVGFHYPNEILPGTFSTGNYVFDGDLSVNDDFDVKTYSLDVGSISSGDHNSDGYADFEAGRVSSAYGTKFVGSASLMLEEYDDPFLLVGRQTKFQNREDTVLSFYRKKLGLGINLPQYTFDVNGTQRISTNNSVDYNHPALLLDLRGHSGYPGDDLALKIMMDGDGDVNKNGFFDVGNDDVAIEVLSRVDPADDFSIAYRLWSNGVVFVNKSIGIGTMTPQGALDVRGNVYMNGSLVATQDWVASNVSSLIETDPTVPSNIKDGISWSEVSSKPAGFADGVDNVGITTETDTLGNVLSRGNSFGTYSSIKTDQGGSIELGGFATTPYIDFKNNNIDYDARIILDGNNKLDIEGADLYVDDVRVLTQDDLPLPPVVYIATKAQRGTTVIIPESVISQYCGDLDGCRIRQFMHDWDGNGLSASTDNIFYYNSANRWWRDSNERSNSQARNSDGVTNHVDQWWACYFTDGAYSSWSDQGDSNSNFGLLSWNQYNADCKMVIYD